MIARKIGGGGKDAPPCVAPVRVSSKMTITRHIREQNAKAAGHPPDQCGRPATYEVDGDCLCRAHAGDRALHYVLTNHRRAAAYHRAAAEKASRPCEAHAHIKFAEDHERVADQKGEPAL